MRLPELPSRFVPLRRCIRSAAAAGAMLLLCACGKPQPPDKERPPEPQATAQPAVPAQGEHTELRDAIQRPVQRAEQVEVDVQKGADAQRAAIEAAGG